MSEVHNTPWDCICSKARYLRCAPDAYETNSARIVPFTTVVFCLRYVSTTPVRQPPANNHTQQNQRRNALREVRFLHLQQRENRFRASYRRAGDA